MTNPSFSLLIEIIFMKRWPQLWRFCLLHKTGSEDSRCHRSCSTIQRVGIVVQLLYYNTILYNTTIFNSDANCKLKRESTLSLTRWPADAMQSKAHTMKWNTAIDRYSTGRTDTTTHIQQVCCPNKLHGKYHSNASCECWLQSQFITEIPRQNPIQNVFKRKSVIFRRKIDAGQWEHLSCYATEPFTLFHDMMGWITWVDA